jgi:hypothetical protein
MRPAFRNAHRGRPDPADGYTDDVDDAVISDIGRSLLTLAARQARRAA